MRPFLLLAAAAVFMSAPLAAQEGTLVPNIEAAIIDPVTMLHGTDPGSYVALRGALKSILWDGHPPSVAPVVYPLASNIVPYDTWLDPVLGTTPYKAMWLDFVSYGNIHSHIIYAQMAPTSNGCLFLYHAGHGQGFIKRGDTISQNPDFYPVGVKALAQDVASRGCDLLLFSMPFWGENRLDAQPGMTHDSFATFKPDHGSALRYFIDPVMLALDYATAQRTYTKIGMAGLSGGGWTTTLAAAIDPRIQHSYLISGSLPIYARQPGEIGDWEQSGASEVYGQFDYLDLYLMAVAEPGRHSIHFHATEDPCCFRAASALAYSKEMTRYAREEGFGPLRFFADRAAVHDATAPKRARIIDDFFDAGS